MATTKMTFEQAYKLAPQQEYFSGNPPEIGWWMTYKPDAIVVPEYAMRYWNGESWGVYCTPSDTCVDTIDQESKDWHKVKPTKIQYCARFWEGK